MDAAAADERSKPGEPDLQEYRAYLQRAETRLSTLHRVAGAFISGAGLLTLLPLLMSGTFSGLLALILFYPTDGLPAAGSVQRWLALIPVLASLALPVLALYLLIRDLILFYFTARTFRTDKSGLIYPRFILSGIMVSENSLNGGIADLERARQDEYVRNLLVPSPSELRGRILSEAHSIGALKGYTLNDHEALLVTALRGYVLQQTASHPRPLADEAAKMEASLARHLRFLRGLVLRYAKAFLLTIVTTVVTIAANGVLSLLRPLDTMRLDGVNPQYVWLAMLTIYALWALVAVVIVRRPVAWLYADTSNSKNQRTPQSLLNFERLTLAVGIAATVIVECDVIFYIDMVDVATGGGWLLTIAAVAIGLGTAYVTVFALTSERTAGKDR